VSPAFSFGGSKAIDLKDKPLIGVVNEVDCGLLYV
jgi:hypothetical protein